MTLEQEPYSHYPQSQNRRSVKGRSASIPAPPPGYDNNPSSGENRIMNPNGGGGGGGGRRGIPGGILINPSNGTRENGQSARYHRTSIEDYSQPPLPPNNGGGPSSLKQLGGNALPPTTAKNITNQHQAQPNPTTPIPSSAPTTTTTTTTTSSQQQQQRKHGAHRSQSARVVGSKPKLKRRAIRDYQQHLDLASSEGALRDCEDSYNPFLRKVPSTGRLITANSGEMSNSSLYNPSPAAPQPAPIVHQQSSPHSTPPRDSPKVLRRQSTAFEVRRGSDKSTPEKDRKGLGTIPAISTPECSPLPQRRGSTKPSGLPKSPQVIRSTSTRRANSVKGRRNTTFLDVPDRNPSPPEDEDEESYRLRTFNVTSKGNQQTTFSTFTLSRSLLSVPPSAAEFPCKPKQSWTGHVQGKCRGRGK